MKVLGINGSPNQAENTSFLLAEALTGAQEEGANTQILHIEEALNELETPFCVHCSSPCNQSCYQDSLVEEYFTLMAEAEGIILASPVYFGTVSGQLKSFWDLTRDLRSKEELFNTVGGAIAVGASRFGGQETTVRALQDMMLVQGMTIVGDGVLQVGMGHQGACGQKEVETDNSGQQAARNLGRRVVQTAGKVSE